MRETRVARVLTLDRQVGAWPRVVVVDRRDGARRQSVPDHQRVNVLLIDSTARWCFIADRLVRLAMRLQRAHRVAQHEPVLAIAVLEEPENPPFLPEALQEGPVALGMLTLDVALGPRTVRTWGREALVDRKRVRGQHGVGDLDHGQVLEIPCVAVFRGIPQPRAQRQLVDDRAAILAQDARSAHDARNFARAGADIGLTCLAGETRNKVPFTLDLDRDGDFGADQLVEFDVRRNARRKRQRIGSLQYERVPEQFAERFASSEPDWRQDGLPAVRRQRRAGDGQRPLRTKQLIHRTHLTLLLVLQANHQRPACLLIDHRTGDIRHPRTPQSSSFSDGNSLATCNARPPCRAISSHRGPLRVSS